MEGGINSKMSKEEILDKVNKMFPYSIPISRVESAVLKRSLEKEAEFKELFYMIITHFGEGGDLSLYAKKTEIPTIPDLSLYAKKAEIPSIPDLSLYAKKTEIPSNSDIIALIRANTGTGTGPGTRVSVGPLEQGYTYGTLNNGTPLYADLKTANNTHLGTADLTNEARWAIGTIVVCRPSTDSTIVVRNMDAKIMATIDVGYEATLGDLYVNNNFGRSGIAMVAKAGLVTTSLIYSSAYAPPETADITITLAAGEYKQTNMKGFYKVYSGSSEWTANYGGNSAFGGIQVAYQSNPGGISWNNYGTTPFTLRIVAW